MADKEDVDVFEITDFTNASPWESFISSIEDVLAQWGLSSSGELAMDNSYQQHNKSERLTYAGHKFIVSLHVPVERLKPLPIQPDKDWPDAMVQMMDTSNNFPPKAHHITRWYGVHEFILISPDEQSEALTSEAQAKLMISSVSLAVANTGCTTPIFIQTHKNWRHIYVGICQANGIRTNFEMVHLKYTNPQFNHLSGLLDIFKSKIRQYSKSMIVGVAAQFTYNLRHWSLDMWPVEPFGDMEGLLTEKTLSSFPVGATTDPVRELHLSAVWLDLTEETIVDNDSHSGFNPLYAPVWSVKTHLVDNPNLLLYGCLNTFLKICYRTESITDLLGNKLLHEDIYSPGVGGSDFSHALTKLTDPSGISSLSSVMYSTSHKLELGSEFEPITDAETNSVLEYLFPDACPKSPSNRGLMYEVTEEDSTLVKTIKSAPYDSFTGRLTRTLCTVAHENGLKACAHIWYEVVLELRHRWESGILIPRLKDEAPDLFCCLLHQKLQMLNCCIRHKVSRTINNTAPVNQSTSSFMSARSGQESEFYSPASSLSYSQRVQEQQPIIGCEESGREIFSTGSSDDEFFEANESFDSERMASEHASKNLPLKDKRESLISDDFNFEAQQSPDHQPKALDMKPVDTDPLSLLASEENDMRPLLDTPEHRKAAEMANKRLGATGPYKDLVLIATGEPLYVPETQQPTPLTEDMLWEQQDVLSKLGTSQEAAQVRAKMQSLSLTSDMQAFKAANPHCTLEDFVRWYSPRDWIEGEEGEGEEPTLEGESTQEENKSIEVTHAIDGWEAEIDDLDLPSIPTQKFVEGHLSLRMKQPGNMWKETWDSAAPIPAYKQKRLFDDTKEAEKVLHFLSGLKPSELAIMLLPSLLHSAIVSLQQRLSDKQIPVAQGHVEDALNILKTVHRPCTESLPIYQECLGLLQQAESLLAISTSLTLKLQQGAELCGMKECESTLGKKELNASIQLLLEGPELVLQEPTTSLTGAALKGLLIAQAASTTQNSLKNKQDGSESSPSPTASCREFILRVTTPRPSVYSNPSPQRMYCILSKEEMRLAGAFSEDVLTS